MSGNSASAGTGSGNGTERWLFRALLALVALAPLPLGSNRPLPAAILSLAAGLLLALWAAALLTGRAEMALSPRKLRWPLGLFGAVVLWILVQALPLPSAWGDPVWREAGAALGETLRASLSVDPQATLSGLMRLLAYAAVFWLTLQLTRAPERARLAIAAAAIIGAAYALYGIAIYAAGNEWVTIYRKWAYHQALSSTFVNRNSYATFAGLGLICATAWFVNSFRHLLGIKRPAARKAALIAEEIFGRSLLRTASVLLLFVALILTGSRAGTAASLIALFVLMLTYARGGALRGGQAVLVAALVAGIALLAIGLGGGLLFERLSSAGSDVSADDRRVIYAATLDAISTAPWTGTGYGTYSQVFAAWRPEALSSSVLWDKAHHVYLENALELGVPAMLALNLAIALLAAEALRGLWRRRRERTAPAIGVAATVLVGLHSFFDFSLQMPAIAVFYAFLMGLAVAQAWPQGRGRTG